MIGKSLRDEQLGTFNLKLSTVYNIDLQLSFHGFLCCGSLVDVVVGGEMREQSAHCVVIIMLTN